ncbi:hypothetical protein [Nocardia stercoris]|uniref:Uncharacterized protein n=1 Tax=Nocardia stercoris TaxID=2483361 RepID=A0A3M2KVE6_9NOCA|nr:hypothetical protein [Nocardia stercoris]RMI28974.1 hypothetical protein EBN03_27965 [Nocardia stercoris]
MDLLDDVVNAYGGIERWRQLDTITAHQRVGGVLWTLKGVDGILDDSTVQIRVQEERTWLRPASTPDVRLSFGPDRVTIETDDPAARVVEELADPRDSFAGHTLETPWSTLQLAYFSGYAMWTYLSEPYSLTLPGVYTEELSTWHEDGQTWRRLGVRYPDTIATHSAVQVLYIDADGLIRRRDYEVDISANSPAAHYSSDFLSVDGIVLPTNRVVYGRDASGHRVADPILVTVALDNVTVG